MMIAHGGASFAPSLARLDTALASGVLALTYRRPGTRS
jgi:hypothetical protein